jgi:hypothetical protein
MLLVFYDYLIAGLLFELPFMVDYIYVLGAFYGCLMHLDRVKIWGKNII